MPLQRPKNNRKREQNAVRHRARRHLRVESLEDRRMLSAIPVTPNSISLVEGAIVQTEQSYGKLGEALWQLSESADGSLYGMSKEELAFLTFPALLRPHHT
jgi:hypothetical protein